MKKFALTIKGDFALFTDPYSKIGGEKFSYNIPTYEAIKGIIRSVFWKPTIVWVIDRVRIMNQIKTISKSVRPLAYGGNDTAPTIALYVYLTNVEYQVEFHYEWNESRIDLVKDRKELKYNEMVERFIKKGGHRDIFLGTRECQGFVLPCNFGEGVGYYDGLDEMPFSLMFHSFGWPNENKIKSEQDKFITKLWKPTMRHGVIEFENPDNCTIKRVVRQLNAEQVETLGIDYQVN